MSVDTNYYLRKGETRDAYDKRIESYNASKRPSSSLQGTMKETPVADPVSSFSNFAAALNKAVSLARNQRQSADLDMLGKQIKPGSVSASSFTSLLSDINNASNSFTKPLVTDALDVSKIQEDNQNAIRDLALKLVENGAKKEVIQGVLNAPDIDSAIAMSAGALNASSKDDIRSVGRQLVRVNPQTGAAEVIFTGPNDTAGEQNTGFFKSGALKIDNADIGEGSRMLSSTRGADGFTNTEKYTEMYQHWVDNGGLPQDFFKQYDPDFYLNPDDPTIPSYITSQMKKTEEDNNPFK